MALYSFLRQPFNMSASHCSPEILFPSPLIPSGLVLSIAGERDSVEICAGKKCGRPERGAVSEAEQPNAGDGVQQPAFGETGKD